VFAVTDDVNAGVLLLVYNLFNGATNASGEGSAIVIFTDLLLVQNCYKIGRPR
jgi:hypothetical protein